ncbi:MAG: molybdenum cofactor guanylyltransferase [Gemmatimonadetes bacterium]|nr:molybdenum cofactor guanylyltransferase [Gemmatimonadota bacterium]
MSQSRCRLLGAVLAGGASRRYGRDKAHELVGGVSMLTRGVTVLRAVFDDVVVVADALPDSPVGVRVVPDLRANSGPLAGLEAALREARQVGCDGVFLLGCDLPLVTRSVVQSISDAWDGVDALVVPARGRTLAADPSSTEPDGFEPLCAVYGLGLLPLVEEHLERGELSLHALIDAAGTVVVAGIPDSEGGREPFLNVNTPEDRLEAERVLDRGRP